MKQVALPSMQNFCKIKVTIKTIRSILQQNQNETWDYITHMMLAMYISRNVETCQLMLMIQSIAKVNLITCYYRLTLLPVNM